MQRNIQCLSLGLLGLLILSGVGTAQAAEWIGAGPEGGQPVVVSVELVGQRALVQVSIPGAWLDGVEGAGLQFDRLEIPGAIASGVVGDPGLPQVGLLVSLPEGRAASVSLVDQEAVALGELLVAPLQEKPCRCDESFVPEFAYNEDTYLGATAFNSQPVAALDSRGFMRDVRVARLLLRPFNYDVASGELALLTSITVEIDLSVEDPSAVPGRQLTAVPRSFRPVLGAIDIQLAGGTKDDVPGPDHMLVIGPDNYLEVVQPLVDWRIETGTQVTVASTTETGSSADAIAGYIRDAYDNWAPPPSVVLFVGDENAVPPLWGTVEGAASDYLYALLEGNDVYPDVIMGRLSASSAANIGVQVNKTLNYETAPELGAAWYEGAIVISSSEGSGESNDDVRSDIIYGHLDDWGFDPLEKYYASMGTNSIGNINGSIDEGISWLSYMGHGSGTGWSSTEPYYDGASEIPTLGNGSKLPVIWDVACTNGHFDDGAPCFAEMWMNAEGKGAVAMWAATVTAAWDEPAVWSVEASRVFAEEGHFRFGAVAIAAMIEMIGDFGTGNNVVSELEKYVLFGDPLLEMRSKIPVEIDVEHPEVMPEEGGAFVVDVTVEGESLLGARVAASQNGQVLSVETTTPDGKAALAIPALTEQFVLTVTGRDAVAYQTDVPLGDPGGSDADGDGDGDGDGDADDDRDAEGDGLDYAQPGSGCGCGQAGRSTGPSVFAVLTSLI